MLSSQGIILAKAPQESDAAGNLDSAIETEAGQSHTARKQSQANGEDSFQAIPPYREIFKTSAKSDLLCALGDDRHTSSLWPLGRNGADPCGQPQSACGPMNISRRTWLHRPMGFYND